MKFNKLRKMPSRKSEKMANSPYLQTFAGKFSDCIGIWAIQICGHSCELYDMLKPNQKSSLGFAVSSNVPSVRLDDDLHYHDLDIWFETWSSTMWLGSMSFSLIGRMHHWACPMCLYGTLCWPGGGGVRWWFGGSCHFPVLGSLLVSIGLRGCQS